MEVPRPAATVVVARPAEQGVEVLVLTRGSTIRWQPGFVVFPGGAIEAQDEALAARWFGDRGETARACALRELYEEAGLLLTSDGLVERRRTEPVERIRFDPPSAAALVEISRWVAPEILDRRFDARFFAAGASSGLRPRVDGIEIESATWARPAELLEASTAVAASPLAWPTFVTLQALAGCETVTDVLALRVEQVPPGTPG